MSDTDDPRLEAIAETIAFAHEAESQSLSTNSGSAALALEFERCAALATAALTVPLEPPPQLTARLAAAGLSFCASQRALAATPVTGGFTTLLPHRKRPAVWLSFLAGAAAASMLLWLTALSRPSESLWDLRRQVLATDGTALRLDWQCGPSPRAGKVRGDVVWCQDRQQGWLTFRGLEPLDADHRYQLWIVDGTRDGFPVDGGLFHIDDPEVESIVPITAKLPIGRPKGFVVTVEPKHGAVVSQQEHVVAIAGL